MTANERDSLLSTDAFQKEAILYLALSLGSLCE